MSSLSTFSVRDGTRRAAILIASCILAIVAARVLRASVLPELPNFSPLIAAAFCGALFLPGLLAWILPLGALVISDLALSLTLGFPLFSGAQAGAWLCTLAVVGLGRWLASRKSFGLFGYFGTLLGGSVIFYLVTNALGWLLNPAYPRGLEGLWMSLTVGLSGFPPTWMFFRNSLVSDLLFGALVLLVWVAARRPTVERTATVPAC